MSEQPFKGQRFVLDANRPMAAVLVFLLALAVRVTAVYVAPDVHWGPYDKAFRYDPIAVSLLNGEGFAFRGSPTAYAAPLYPVLLAGVYGVVGKSDRAAYLVLAGLDAVTCVFFFLIARRLFGGDVAILTALGSIVLPYLIYSVLLGGSDTLFIFLNAAFLWLMVRAVAQPSWGAFAASGAVLGLASLARANSLLLPLLILPIVVLRKPWKRWLGLALVFLAAYMATLTPWTVRNYMVFHRLVPIQTLGGAHLAMAAPVPKQLEKIPPKEQRPKGEVGRTQTDAFFYRLAVKRILADPVAYAKGVALRIVRLWYVTQSGRFRSFIVLGNSVLLTLAVVGMALVRRRWRELLPVYAMIAYYVLIQSAFIASFRYLLPIVPMVLMLATVSGAAALQAMRRRLGWEVDDTTVLQADERASEQCGT